MIFGVGGALYTKRLIIVVLGEIAEAKKTLQGAILLPGVKTIGRKASAKQRSAEISVNDRVSVFLELAEAHLALDEQVTLWLIHYYLDGNLNISL